jgi:STIP1 family protein 1
MCARRVGDWGRVKDDCEKALQFDKYNTKAGYLLGQFHCDKCEFRQAIDFFEQAVEMSSRQGKPKSFTMEVTQALRRAKKEFHKVQEAKREKKLTSMREFMLSSLQEHRSMTQERGDPESVSQELADDYIASFLGLIEESCSKRQHEVPDALCCPISMEIVQDPVVTPSGLSYERKCLEEHLRKSNIDPITRKPLSASQLIANTALKQAADLYLDENPWAFECD